MRSYFRQHVATSCWDCFPTAAQSGCSSHSPQRQWDAPLRNPPRSRIVLCLTRKRSVELLFVWFCVESRGIKRESLLFLSMVCLTSALQHGWTRPSLAEAGMGKLINWATALLTSSQRRRAGLLSLCKTGQGNAQERHEPEPGRLPLALQNMNERTACARRRSTWLLTCRLRAARFRASRS